MLIDNKANLSRRDLLKKSGCGFGSLAFSALMAQEGLLGEEKLRRLSPVGLTLHQEPRVSFFCLCMGAQAMWICLTTSLHLRNILERVLMMLLRLKAPEVLEGCFLLHINFKDTEKVDIGFLIDILTYRK